MRVDIDEPWRYDEPSRVDDPRRARFEGGFDRNDGVAGDAHVGAEPRIAGAVDNMSAAYDEIEGRALCLRGATCLPKDDGRERKCQQRREPIPHRLHHCASAIVSRTAY